MHDTTLPLTDARDTPAPTPQDHDGEPAAAWWNASQRRAALVSNALLPYYAWKGLQLRSSSMRLSPAIGPRSGQFGKGKPTIRLLAIGDSSAAAVGIPHTSGAFGPQLAGKLHERRGETVSWHISGHNSATAGQIRDLVVPNLAAADYTHIMLQIGVNDLKNWHSGKKWCAQFGGLLYALRAKFPEAKLFWSQPLDCTLIPGVPARLGQIMNMRRVIIKQRGTQLCVERGAVVISPLPNVRPEGFSIDRFHANEAGYEAWAEHTLTHWDYDVREAPAAEPYL